ncbi:MAG: phosphoribosylformylglycinamidine synthase subunit PurQ [Acidobacteria bacterium]|nr:phosphoribosylformylglycinamidine synthase subunit PurQ [Acidobacteriota bacterium]
MTFAVIVFPGSNSDHDAFHAASAVVGQHSALVWHKDTSLGGADAVILPGGFAHGDYLRTGAIAKFSPIMAAVSAFAERGGPVLGICNGFQVLLEAGLLPGAMVRNRAIKFMSKLVNVRVEAVDTPFTAACTAGQVLRLPIAHGEGNYFAAPEVIDALEHERRVVFRYVDETGQASEAGNPNGSLNNIAGICNARRNVVGLMPHPERACEPSLGSADGRIVLESAVRVFASGVAAGRSPA